MFSIGVRSGLQPGPIQHPDSSTTKPCCCNSCCMCFYIVLLKYTFLNIEQYVALKPLYTFQHSQCLTKHASCSYHMHPHTSEILAFELNSDDTLEGLPLLQHTTAMISKNNCKNLIWTRLTEKTLLHFSLLFLRDSASLRHPFNVTDLMSINFISCQMFSQLNLIKMSCFFSLLLPPCQLFETCSRHQILNELIQWINV